MRWQRQIEGLIMTKLAMPIPHSLRAEASVVERTEGWGNVINARDAHYFIDDRSLCRRWLAWGGPRWESNQALGSTPGKGTCKACWKKAEKMARASTAGRTK